MPHQMPLQRGVVLDGASLVATGFVGNNEGGFLFIADGDNARAMAWKFDLSGNLETTTALGVDGMQQGAKVWQFLNLEDIFNSQPR